jgi:hypothetical protein
MTPREEELAIRQRALELACDSGCSHTSVVGTAEEFLEFLRKGKKVEKPKAKRPKA